ncbi:hypothetical protein QR685DRAFT_434269, partial [Neurospora intermedia]
KNYTNFIILGLPLIVIIANIQTTINITISAVLKIFYIYFPFRSEVITIYILNPQL